jgi:hypothetical protein
MELAFCFDCFTHVEKSRGSFEYKSGQALQLIWEFWREKSLLQSGIVLSALQSIPSHLLFIIWEICDRYIIFGMSVMWKLRSQCLLRKQKICTLSLCCRDCTWIFSFYCCTRLRFWSFFSKRCCDVHMYSIFNVRLFQDFFSQLFEV